MAKTEVLMKVNGGIWVKLDQEQDRVKFSNKNVSAHAPPTQFHLLKVALAMFNS